jgi:hypothetical protein
MLPEVLQHEFRRRKDEAGYVLWSMWWVPPEDAGSAEPQEAGALSVPAESGEPEQEPNSSGAGGRAADGGDGPVMSLRRVGKNWRLRYPNDQDGDFPVKDHKFLGWLAKLLSKPGYPWTVAELYGDPEGKIKADAALGGERARDWEYLRRIWDRIQEIDITTQTTGGSAELAAERGDLLQQVRGHSATELMEAEVRKAYHNVTTQLRLFLKTLAREGMPRLAAHLRTALKTSSDDCAISYRPPAGTPGWVVENPTT